MVCKDSHVEALLNRQENITEEGILSSEDAFPMSVLDISTLELDSIRQYMTVDAFRDMYQLGE